MAVTDADLRHMHSQNQTAIEHLTDRICDIETLFFGKKDDPKDNGLKGDIQGIKNVLKWLVRVGLGLIAAFLFTRYPDIAKAILQLASGR